MSDILIEVESGKSKRLKTANKLCKDDIVVTGTGGSGGGKDYIKYAATVTFSNAISEETDDIYLDLSNVTNAQSMLVSKTINAKKITAKFSSACISLRDAFRAISSTTLEEIEFQGDTSGVQYWVQTFSYSQSVKRITGEPLDFSSGVSTTAFVFMGAIEEVRFKEGTIKVSTTFANSPNLSADSIQSIIDGLADLTGATAQTISWHTSVLEKLTDEQYDTMFNKNWEPL